MGHGEFGGVDDRVAEEQKIEVERPLAPADGPDPPQPLLDLLEPPQKRRRVEARLEGGGGVEESTLAGRARRRLRSRGES